MGDDDIMYISIGLLHPSPCIYERQRKQENLCSVKERMVRKMKPVPLIDMILPEVRIEDPGTIGD